MKCPNCENDEKFYVKVRFSGSSEEYYDFKGNYLEDFSNSGTYDNVKITQRHVTETLSFRISKED